PSTTLFPYTTLFRSRLSMTVGALFQQDASLAKSAKLLFPRRSPRPNGRREAEAFRRKTAVRDRPYRSLAHQNETMGTRGTHGTKYFDLTNQRVRRRGGDERDRGRARFRESRWREPRRRRP